jgi:hypothetical protein
MTRGRPPAVSALHNTRLKLFVSDLRYVVERPSAEKAIALGAAVPG